MLSSVLVSLSYSLLTFISQSIISPIKVLRAEIMMEILFVYLMIGTKVGNSMVSLGLVLL